MPSRFGFFGPAPIPRPFATRSPTQTHFEAKRKECFLNQSIRLCPARRSPPGRDERVTKTVRIGFASDRSSQKTLDKNHQSISLVCVIRNGCKHATPLAPSAAATRSLLTAKRRSKHAEHGATTTNQAQVLITGDGLWIIFRRHRAHVFYFPLNNPISTRRTRRSRHRFLCSSTLAWLCG